MARCDNLALGRDLTKRVGETLNLQFIKNVQINTGTETNAELTITILLTEEQEKKIIGEE